MAKSRTPPPPRRVQAPKRRTDEAAVARRRRVVLLGVVAAVVVGAAVAATVILVSRSGSSAEETLRAAGCTIQQAPAQGRQHVDRPPEDFQFNTTPPTTGPHNGQWAPWDVYTEPVEQFRLVHNLEHGGVVIQYGDDVPQSTVDAIVGWYREDPNGLVVAPFPQLGDKVALQAWVTPETAPEEPGRGVVATCPGFDAGVFDTFVEEYGFRGPERFDRGDLQPGT